MRRTITALLAVVLLTGSCQSDPAPTQQFAPPGASVREPTPPIERDLEAIRAAGKLVMLAPSNSTTYFVYRGEPLGFEFELLRAFAKEHEIPLEVRVVADATELFERLNRGEGDVAAGRLVPRPEDTGLVAFTRPLYRTEPALIQQQVPPEESSMPEPAKAEVESDPAPAPVEQEISVRLVQKPEQLAGEKVHLPEKSAYSRTLIELSDEITGDVHVVEVGGNVDDEALITKVARGDVEFTVAQSNLAELKESIYSNVKVRPIVGPQHRVAWAVRRNAPELLDALDRWIEEKANAGLGRQLYTKYFTDRKGYKERVESAYLTSVTGKLSPFDPLFRRYATDLGWDWRLLASQAYQESRFKPDARSWAGAEGLLQLMPATGREFGVRNPRDPEDNVRAAVKFLAWLTRYWEPKIPDDGERLKFILASYNTGAGHVEDAQRLTSKYGGSLHRWHDVAYWLLQKSKSQYASDPVVKYGYCRGLEPVTYVALILERFQHYRQFVETQVDDPQPK